MTRNLMIISIFIFVGSSLKAQKMFGEVLPDDFEQKTTFTQQDNINVDKLPKVVDLSLKLPPAGNQNPRGTCWAFASTYALISYMYNKSKADNYFILNNGMPNYTKIKSPEIPVQLYFEGQSDCDQGALSKDLLLKTLKDYGNLSWSEIPYSYQCNKPLSQNQKNKAKKNTFLDYDVEVIKNTDLNSMKQILAKGQPLLISIAVDDNFSNIPDNVKEDNKPLWSEYGYNQGGHAMTIVGYNDNISAVKVLNSWGTKWGNNGYLWISYKILNNNARYYCYPIIREQVTKTNANNFEKSFIGTIINKIELSTWAKQGYYRNFNDIRVGVSSLNPKKLFALIDIRDTSGTLLTSFYLDRNTTKEFYINKDKYSVKFDNIGSAGKNPFKKALFFTIRKVNEK